MDFNHSLQAKTHIKKKNKKKNSNFACASFQEKFNSPPLKPSPVSESSTQPLQNYVCFFPTHLHARELCPQTYSLSLLLEWSQITHMPASIKLGGVYKSEKSAFYSTFARQLCDDTRLPGWLSAFPVHSQTFKPTQASFAHTNSQPSHSMGYKIFLVFFFLSFFFLFFFKSVSLSNFNVPCKKMQPVQSWTYETSYLKVHKSYGAPTGPTR